MNSSEETMNMQNEPTQQKASGGGNRSALWALLGVGVGFLLPIAACIGLFVLSSVAIGQIAGRATPTGTTPSLPEHVSGPATGPAVALIDLEGPIVSGSAPAFSNAAVAAADDLIPLIERAGANPHVKAIVLRVNSPGGGVVPSDRIHHALEQVEKPIVVVMGDMAASGGVYVSMAADHIVANPNTLTGSIGVISQFPNAQELLDKLGVEIAVVKSGENKDFGSPYRPMEPEERELWEGIIDETYDRFVAIVAEARGLSQEEVRAFADGRILSASQALDRDLIDATGYEEDAIAEAAGRGEISGEPRVLHYRRSPTFLQFLGSGVMPDGLSLLGLPAELQRHLFAPSLDYRWSP